MDAAKILQDICQSEIPYSIDSVTVGCFEAHLCDGRGEKLHGKLFTSGSIDEVAAWLDEQVRLHCPDSVYALGEEEFRRRQATVCE